MKRSAGILVYKIENADLDFGAPSKEVFSKVPIEYVIDSNYGDTLECANQIVSNLTYCILNLCRFYALIKDGLTLSKYDGGKWAIENMNSDFNDPIALAMDDYMSNSKIEFDEEKLKLFVIEAINLINSVMTMKGFIKNE